jgi:hypothetical protein
MAILTLNTAIARKAVQKLELLIADTSQVVLSGNIQNYDKYREQIGLIQGLRRAIQAIEEVEAEVSHEGTQ